MNKKEMQMILDAFQNLVSLWPHYASKIHMELVDIEAIRDAKKAIQALRDELAEPAKSSTKKIYYEPEINFENCLEQIAQHTPPIVDQKCPHCGLVAHHPVVMRDSDRRMFEELMAEAQAVLNRNGVTAHLLSELHAQIAVAKAKRSDK